MQRFTAAGIPVRQYGSVLQQQQQLQQTGITQVHWNKYTDYILNFFEISQKVKHVTQSELNYKKSPVKIYLCRIKEQNFLLYFRPCTFMHFRFLSFFWLKSMRLYHKAVSED